MSTVVVALDRLAVGIAVADADYLNVGEPTYLLAVPQLTGGLAVWPFMTCLTLLLVAAIGTTAGLVATFIVRFAVHRLRPGRCTKTDHAQTIRPMPCIEYQNSGLTEPRDVRAS